MKGSTTIMASKSKSKVQSKPKAEVAEVAEVAESKPSKIESKPDVSTLVKPERLARVIGQAVDRLPTLVRGSSPAFPTPLQSWIRVKSGTMKAVKELNFKEGKSALLNAARSGDGDDATAQMIRESIVGYLVGNLLSLQADHALLYELLNQMTDKEIASVIGTQLIMRNGHKTETTFSINEDTIKGCRAFLNLALDATEDIHRQNVSKSKGKSKVDVTKLIL